MSIEDDIFDLREHHNTHHPEAWLRIENHINTLEVVICQHEDTIIDQQAAIKTLAKLLK